MIHDLNLSKDDCPVTDSEIIVWTSTPFVQLSLMFVMVAIRVDIYYAVIAVARFTENPGMPHWIALVCIFKYLKETSDMILGYVILQLNCYIYEPCLIFFKASFPIFLLSSSTKSLVSNVISR